MAVSYNRLWKLLIDKGMNKTQLIKEAKISTNYEDKPGDGRQGYGAAVQLRPGNCTAK